MEILFLCLLGAFTTWAVVDAVKSDEDEADHSGTPEPEPGVEQGVDVLLEADGTYVGTETHDLFTAPAPPPIGEEADDEDRISGQIDALGGDDSIFGNYAQSEIAAGAGHDHLSGKFFESTLSGDSGNDLLEGRFNASQVDAGSGDDTITGVSRYSTLEGGVGRDSFDVFLGGGELHAGADDDSITADAQLEAKIYGGDGDDQMTVYGQLAQVYGDDGNDVINATRLTRGDVYGGAGNDTLTFSPDIRDEGSISLFGGEGDDRFVGSFTTYQQDAVSFLTGGEGADIYDFDLTLAQSAPVDFEGSTINNVHMATIHDFEVGTDRIELDITGGHHEISLIERTDGSGSDLSIRYSAYDPEDDDMEKEYLAYFHLEGVNGVTLADIGIAGAPTSPPAVSA